MVNAIEQHINNLRHRLRTGPLGKFFGWWVEELKLALPEAWQEKLQHATRRLAITARENFLELGVLENRKLTPLGEVPLTQDTSLQRQQIRDLRVESELEEAPAWLLLNSDSVLAREVSLPVAAESNLAQVLTFEMDRQTPFRAAAVYFDWRVLQRGDAGGKLRLMLYVIPRGELDHAVKRLDGTGIDLAGVDIRENGSTLYLNLLPEERRHRVVNRKARLNWALSGFAAVLLASVMVFSLALRAHQVAELEEAIAAVRDEAMQVDRIRNQIENASEAAGFLALRRAEAPLAVALLADITRILPDDTYLDRLVIGRGNVQLQGKSGNAQQLIELVNESPYLAAASFRGSTRLDARTGLEIFEINAEITPTGGNDGAGS
jgi:general secretion pathway protein L